MNSDGMNRDFTTYYDQSNREAAVKKTMLGVYSWMTVALLITAAAGLFVASNENMIDLVSRSYWLFAIAEIVVVIALSARAHKMSSLVAKGWFVVYSVLNGITLSAIFVVYEIGTIGYAFLVTAGVFAVMTIYGYVTKTDLSKIGSLFVMALFGLVIATFVGFFINTPGYTMALMYVTVFIFIGLIGWDTQKIKQYAYAQADSNGALANASILGALTLYLDFINIFISLVRIFGSRD